MKGIEKKRKAGSTGRPMAKLVRAAQGLIDRNEAITLDAICAEGKFPKAQRPLVSRLVGALVRRGFLRVVDRIGYRNAARYEATGAWPPAIQAQRRGEFANRLWGAVLSFAKDNMRFTKQEALGEAGYPTVTSRERNRANYYFWLWVQAGVLRLVDEQHGPHGAGAYKVVVLKRGQMPDRPKVR